MPLFKTLIVALGNFQSVITSIQIHIYSNSFIQNIITISDNKFKKEAMKSNQFSQNVSKNLPLVNGYNYLRVEGQSQANDTKHNNIVNNAYGEQFVSQTYATPKAYMGRTNVMMHSGGISPYRGNNGGNQPKINSHINSIGNGIGNNNGNINNNISSNSSSRRYTYQQHQVSLSNKDKNHMLFTETASTGQLLSTLKNHQTIDPTYLSPTSSTFYLYHPPQQDQNHLISLNSSQSSNWKEVHFQEENAEKAKYWGYQEVIPQDKIRFSQNYSGHRGYQQEVKNQDQGKKVSNLQNIHKIIPQAVLHKQSHKQINSNTSTNITSLSEQQFLMQKVQEYTNTLTHYLYLYEKESTNAEPLNKITQYSRTVYGKVVEQIVYLKEEIGHQNSRSQKKQEPEKERKQQRHQQKQRTGSLVKNHSNNSSSQQSVNRSLEKKNIPPTSNNNKNTFNNLGSEEIIEKMQHQERTHAQLLKQLQIEIEISQKKSEAALLQAEKQQIIHFEETIKKLVNEIKQLQNRSTEERQKLKDLPFYREWMMMCKEVEGGKKYSVKLRQEIEKRKQKLKEIRQSKKQQAIGNDGDRSQKKKDLQKLQIETEIKPIIKFTVNSGERMLSEQNLSEKSEQNSNMNQSGSKISNINVNSNNQSNNDNQSYNNNQSNGQSNSQSKSNSKIYNNQSQIPFIPSSKGQIVSISRTSTMRQLQLENNSNKNTSINLSVSNNPNSNYSNNNYNNSGTINTANKSVDGNGNKLEVKEGNKKEINLLIPSFSTNLPRNASSNRSNSRNK